jgi:hypothetical protein
MNYELYQLIIVLSAGACGALWHLRPVRPVFGMAGAAGWIISALQARNLTIYSGGTTFQTGSEAWQLVSLGMALLAIVTVVLWYLGVYPPQTSTEDGAAEVPSAAGTDQQQQRAD